MIQTRPAAEPAAALDPRLPMAVQVHALLKREILTLQLRPSEALSEKELSLKLGVSRTPVREALIKLAEEGLVDILPQRGSFVAPIRVAEVMEAQFIREALEVAVVRRAAEQSTAALVERLEASLQRQRRAIEAGEHEAFLRLDEAFHHLLSDGVLLPRSWKVIHNVKGQLDRVRFLSLPEPGHLETLQAQHAAIVTAVRIRDPDLAAEHMRAHLQEVFGSVRLLLRDQPHLFV
ncbi:GntR family transcriptional regulator [Labrys wisconsinensis]|uniref:DNA-binding GntR family transcriptional regulator n=1 Tax=Labrys wisconsinensis TaxID=425677 RepID=A0ABU0JG44_9HYPH|nr:GntR family transcriptional regulator [Labrys wisconsinensis]MDQ0473256.1 DNA-binding GntR family transcriptional regulator [Labrys wisconsinensis]